MTTTSCPTPELLAQLVQGAVTSDVLEQVTSHLDECPQCEQTVNGLENQSSTLVMAIRRLSTDRLDSGLECKDVIERTCLALSHAHESRSVDLSFLSPPQSDHELGRLGGYQILSVLGIGGMGLVLEGRDEQLQRTVAIKVMHPEAALKPAARERFLREARAAAAIRHAHVVTIYQVGDERSIPFLAMERLHGETLHQRLHAARKLSVVESLQIARQMALGLAAAHQQGLVHRDIKPGNVWLMQASDSGVPHVKLFDFGLARLVEDDLRITQSGMLVGTPAYMAPEQVRNQDVDHRADLFSLGCVLYEMLTERRPFPARDVLTLLSDLALSTPVAPHLLTSEVSPELSKLVMRLLEKSPANRPASARDVADELELHIQQIATTTASDEDIDFPKAVRRPNDNRTTTSRFTRRSIVGILVTATAALILGLGLYQRSNDRESSATTEQELVANLSVTTNSNVLPNDVDLSATETTSLTDSAPRLASTTTQLRLSGMPINDAQFAAMSDLKQLEALYLDSTLITDISLRSLQELTQLRTLELGNTAISNDGLVHLTALRNLQRLSLGSTETNDIGLRHLAELQSLEWLDLQNSRVGAQGLTAIAALKRLDWLDLTNTQINDACLPMLRDLPLTYLRVGRSSVSDRGMMALAAIETLEDLDLGFTQVTAAGLESFAKIDVSKPVRLKALHLAGESFNDAALQAIVPLKLSRLEIVQTQVTDAGLKTLAEMTSLKSLQMNGNRCSPEGIAALRAALPDCEIRD